MGPALRLFQLFQHSPTRINAGDFSSLLRKVKPRQYCCGSWKYKEYVPLSSEFDLSIFPSARWGGGGGGKAGTWTDWQTLTARGVFSLYLHVTKATPGTADVSGNSFRKSYWSYGVLQLYIAELCPHPCTLRKIIQEQAVLKITLWWRRGATTGCAYLCGFLTSPHYC